MSSPTFQKGQTLLGVHRCGEEGGMKSAPEKVIDLENHYQTASEATSKQLLGRSMGRDTARDQMYCAMTPKVRDTAKTTV